MSTPVEIPERRKRKAGRPLDETAEERILQAGIRLYGRVGWRGATMTAIAREADVGKALLYSRFPSSAEVLLNAFERFVPELTGTFPTIRDLLIAESARMADLYLGPYSLAVNRALIDAAALVGPFPEIVNGMMSRTVLPMRRRIRNAVRDGELPPWTSVTQLLDLIEGAVRMKTTAAPQLSDRVRETIDQYIEQLVDEQLLLLANLGPSRGHGVEGWQPLPRLETAPATTVK